MRCLAICWIWIFYSTGLFGQNTIGLPLVKNYGKTEYKGGSQTWDMDQDATGRMYFANNEGLLTFDGTYWHIFPLPNKTILRSVKVTQNGRVYVGGQGEAGYFSPGASGNLEFHSIISLIPGHSRVFADIWNIEVLNETIFFWASDRIFELSNQTIQVHWAPKEWVYMEQISGKLFAQDKEKGLFEWEKSVWKPIENGNLPGQEIIHGCIPLTADSTLVIGTGASQWVLTGSRLISEGRAPVEAGTYISDVAPINDKEFVLGTATNGCIIVNEAGQRIQTFASREGLQNNSVLSVFADRFGNLWVGMNNGISMIAYNSSIKFIKPNPSAELSGYGSRVFQDYLYVATNGGAYRVRLSDSAADLSFVKGAFEILSNTTGQGYRFDEVNDALLLAHNDGIFQISGSMAVKIAAEPSWLFVPVASVMPAAKILVGNYYGLSWLHYRQNSFSPHYKLNGIRESFRFISIDNENNIWASHPYRGIYKINFTNDSAAYSVQLFTEKDGLPSALDNHVFKIRNRIVFATINGPFEFDKEKGKFLPSTLMAPMLGNTPVRYLKEDSDGNIWFVSDKRLGFLEISKKFGPGYRITYFPEITGQVLSGFEYVYPFNSRNVFISSENGLILINLAKYLNYSAKPRILLSSVSSFGGVDSIFYHGFSSLDPAIKMPEAALPYRGNSLHFEFSSPSYGFQENIEYSYFLEGYDKEWSKWHSKSEKDYTFLPNGNYTFKVKARNNLGIETEYAEFAFRVAAPWYKSGFAYLLYAGILVGMLYSILLYNRKKLERQRRIYEEKQEQLRVVHQLEMEKNEKEIIRLQNEKLASEVSFKNRELANTSMHLVERTDALDKVKETLQRLYKKDTSNAELKRAIHLMNDIERNNSDWERFSASFDEINNDFLKKLKGKFPSLTNNDLKLCAYLQLNMSSKEISQLLNISTRGVEISRYRLRKKLAIPTEANIAYFLNEVVKGEG